MAEVSKERHEILHKILQAKITDRETFPETFTAVYPQARGAAAAEVSVLADGARGIGTMAIQVAKARGAVVACTAGTPAKLERCRELGADLAISHRDDDFVPAVQRIYSSSALPSHVILPVMP